MDGLKGFEQSAVMVLRSQCCKDGMQVGAYDEICRDCGSFGGHPLTESEQKGNTQVSSQVSY